jgi:hypothetical protein
LHGRKGWLQDLVRQFVMIGPTGHWLLLEPPPSLCPAVAVIIRAPLGTGLQGIVVGQKNVHPRRAPCFALDKLKRSHATVAFASRHAPSKACARHSSMQQPAVWALLCGQAGFGQTTKEQ